MRRLAVLTTTAAVAMFGVAHADTTNGTISGSPQTATMQNAISAYAAYHADVTDLRKSQISANPDLESALDRVARHNRDDMTRGWVAYGGNIAAQSPTFVQGVRDAASFYGKDAVIWAVSVDPSYARSLRGGNDATRLVLAAAAADAARITNVADRYQEMAYSLQRQRWANAVAPGQPARLSRVRGLGQPGSAMITVADSVSPRLSIAPLTLSQQSDPTAYGGRRFWDTVTGAPVVTEVAAQVSYQWKLNGPRGPAVDRMAAIGALEALDAVDTHQTAVTQLMNDPRSRDCFEMAQLQLYQCMSAAHYRYENAFCLGAHGLRDVGLCIGAVAQPDTTAALTPTADTRRQ